MNNFNICFVMCFGICPSSGHDLNIKITKFKLGLEQYKKKLTEYHKGDVNLIEEDMIYYYRMFFTKHLIIRPCCRHYMLTYFGS